MDFWDLTKVIFRRWYMGVPVLALTAGLCVWTWTSSKPDYTVTSYVQLIPPTATAGGPSANQVSNPWLDLGLDSLNSAATLVTLDATFITQLKDGGYADNVAITPGYPNPVATIVVIGNSGDQASRTADLVIDRYQSTVAKLQADRGVRQPSEINSLRLDNGSNIAVTTGKIKRAVIAIGVAGLLSTVAITMAVDTIIRRRIRRRSGEDGHDGEPIRPEPTRPSGPSNPVMIQRPLSIPALPSGRTNGEPREDPRPLVGAAPLGRPGQDAWAGDDGREAGSAEDPDMTRRIPGEDATLILPMSFSARRGGSGTDPQRP